MTTDPDTICWECDHVHRPGQVCVPCDEMCWHQPEKNPNDLP